MKAFIVKPLFAVLAVTLLAGCMSTARQGPLPNDPFYAPVLPQEAEQEVIEDGSIFNVALANGLYSDVKAHRVGDIITVVLQENTTATKSATTGQSRDSDVEIEPITGLGGNVVNLGNESLQLGMSNSNSFNGSASANQSNALSGNISVTVVRVLPNQNLVIRGEKWLTLNNGDEYIRLTGVVRSADISPVNEVLSTKVANARIQYSGTGSFADTQQQGWLTQFFSSKWWPF